MPSMWIVLRSIAVAWAGLGAMAPAEPLSPADAEKFNAAVEVAQSGDPERGHACAVELGQLAERLGDKHPQAAEVLEYAARCHEAAGEYEAMVAARERLVKQFPGSPLARLALLAVVRYHRATLSFERAAAAMEQFVARWPGEQESIDLLQEAALLRGQLGQDKRAIELFDELDKLYGGKHPQRVAMVFWARADLFPSMFPDDQARQAHARAYLQRFGDKGGPARRIVAEVTFAASEWRRACKQKDGLMDLCVTTKPAAPDVPKRGKAPTITCAGPAARTVSVHPRDAGLVASAHKRLRDVVKLGQVLPPVEDPWLRMKVDEALDLAELILADGALEEALAVRPPQNLSFHVDEIFKYSDKPRDRQRYAEQREKREDSTRRFLDYWGKTRERANDLTLRYEQIASRKKSMRGVFAAAARVAIVAQTQVDTLMSAELPKGLGSDAAIKAYCGALRDSTAPVEDAATRALEYCFNRAAVYAYTDPSVEFCAAELERRLPRRYPPQRELFGFVQPPASEPWSAPVQVEPPLDVK